MSHTTWLALPLIVLTSCGSAGAPRVTTTSSSGPLSSPQTTTSSDVREQYDQITARQEAQAAVARNQLRRSDAKTVATAIDLMTIDSAGRTIPRPSQAGELNAPSRPGGFGLVGKYLQAPIEPPSLGEQFCYWYSPTGQSAFVGAWLEVEDTVFVESVAAHQPSSAPGVSVADFTRLLAGASAADFKLGRPCRSPAGYVGVGL